MEEQAFQQSRPTFHWADYLVFALFLLISALVGVFYGIRDKKKQNTQDFLLGGRQMHWLPVGLSLQATFLSAIFLLGIPSEMYFYGTMYLFVGITHFISFPLAAHLYLPIYHKLKVTSAYEYLEMRFNKTVRIAGSIAFIIMILFYMAVVLYAPSLALSQVTGMPLEFSIITVGAVCTFYTALGGMKATIWNDALQMVVVIVGMMVLAIMGAHRVGGITRAFEIAGEGGRLIWDELDPHLRASFWTQVLGGTFANLALFVPNQTIIQKFNSISKLSDAKKAPWVVSVTLTLILAQVAIVGIVMFAFFHECDPLTTEQVNRPDQMMPFFVLNIMGHLPGLPGLLLATIFSAALSSIAGGLSGLAAVCYVDFVKPLHTKFSESTLTEKQGTWITRGFTVFFGLVNIGMSFLIEFMGGSVIQLATGIFGMLGSPLLGIITCGIFIPCVNGMGALIGLIAGTGLTSWIGIGNALNNIPTHMLPLRTDGCDFNITMTTPAPDMTTLEPPPEDPLLNLYRITHMNYSAIGCCTAIFVAIVVSLIPGCNQPASDVDENLMYPLTTKCFCYCSPKCKSYCEGAVTHGSEIKDENIGAENEATQMSSNGSSNLKENTVFHISQRSQTGHTNGGYAGSDTHLNESKDVQFPENIRL